MNQANFIFLLIDTLAFASCRSDEPRYAAPRGTREGCTINSALCNDEFLSSYHRCR